jgi:hypothetical protein
LVDPREYISLRLTSHDVASTATLAGYCKYSTTHLGNLPLKVGDIAMCGPQPQISQPRIAG